MNDNTMTGNGKNLMIAAMVGAAVGAGVALLLAPNSGKDTRAWLARRGNDLRSRNTSAFQQGRQVIRGAMKEAGQVAADAVSGRDGDPSQPSART